MKTSKVTYLGELRTEMIHNKSSTVIISDAPTDNQGKGEAFSPTDLVATVLGSCMLTIMGIKARDKKWDISNSYMDITKIMASNPRRIEAIKIEMYMNHPDLNSKEIKILEAAAKACPVAQSIHPDILQEVTFIW